MNKTNVYVSGVLVCLLILVGCKTEKQLRQSAADELGRVDLRPEMTLGDLKKALHESNPQVLNTSFANVTILAFQHGLVQARFVNDYSRSFPADESGPDRIAAYAPFKGTVAGMSIRTSYESALDSVRKFYPNAKIEHGSYGDSINLKGTRDDTWFVTRCSTDMDGEKVGGVEVASSTRYTPLVPTN